MTAGKLIEKLQGLGVPIGTPVTVRCEHEDDLGPCFQVRSVSAEYSHADDSLFVAIDCDQELE